MTNESSDAARSAPGRQVRIAAAQYTVEVLSDFSTYAAKQTKLVQLAKAGSAEILLFPEYAALEMTAWQPKNLRTDLAASLRSMQALHDDFLALWQGLARRFDVLIIAPSFPVMRSAHYVNRAYVLAPNTCGYQDKLIMTRFEREHWGISAGCERSVFEFRGLKFGLAICYDSEFPMLARTLAEAGADVLFVPSCTDTWAGFHRVRTGCLARALENQIAVVQAPLVGHCDFQPAIDVNVGRAGFYLPMDNHCPEDGVLAQGDGQSPWLIQDIDLALLERVRADGQVYTRKHWPEQFSPALGNAIARQLW